MYKKELHFVYFVLQYRRIKALSALILERIDSNGKDNYHRCSDRRCYSRWL